MRIITPELFEMTYNDLCNYYLAKYGNAKYDYFSTPECKSVQKKNSRTKEGLEIHHIDENRYPLLSARWAKDMPFECQKADRLVYVNVLEHLLLHIKIFEEECQKEIITGKKAILGRPGIQYLSSRINLYFSRNIPDNWNLNMAKVICKNFNDYIDELVYHLTNISEYKPKEFLSELHDLSKNNDGTYKRKVLNALYKRCASLYSFKVGEKVSHIEYGIGTVFSIHPLKDGYYLGVEFAKSEKKLVSSHRVKKHSQKE